MKTDLYVCNKCNNYIYPAEIENWDGCCYRCESSDLDYRGLVEDSE